MLWMRFRQAKSRKGLTLVEMIAAIAITAILATVLSMMIVPVMNTYKVNSTKVELSQAVTSRLNDIAMFLRGATGVYLSTTKRTTSKVWYNGKDKYFSNTNTKYMFTENMYILPEIRWKEKQDNESDAVKARRVEFDGLRTVMRNNRCYSFVMDNYYERKNGSANAGYLYPELVIGDWSNMSRRYLDYAGGFGMKLASDVYQSEDYWCPNNESMYFLVRTNPDNGNKANALEIHLTVQKGDVSYEGVKTIVCENLAIKGDVIYTNNFQNWTGSTLNKKKAEVSTSSSTTKYFTVWFSMMD